MGVAKMGRNPLVKVRPGVTSQEFDRNLFLTASQQRRSIMRQNRENVRRFVMTSVRYVCLFTATALLGGIPARAQSPREGTLESISADHTQVAARDANGLFIMSVEDQALKDSLKDWNKGDKAKVTVRMSGSKMVLIDIAPQVAPTDPIQRIGVMLAAAAVLLALTFILSWKNLRRVLFIGQDNRYSNSKCQISLWFGVLITSYIAAVFFRAWYGGGAFIGNVNIPAHLAEISGLSALTFAVSKGITQSKAAAASAAAAIAPAGVVVPTKTAAAAPSFPSDLLKDDSGNFDLGDFQMIVITALAFTVYLVQIYQFLAAIQLRVAVTLPDVDSTLLATFGLGQGAYLTKKAVTDIKQ